MVTFRVTADGHFHAGDKILRCLCGWGGIRRDKREGDGATPAGVFALRQVCYRSDRLTAPPTTGLTMRRLNTDDGWCDDPAHPDYNRAVRLPHTGRCEAMWRTDGLYDLLAVIGYNDDPPRPGLGSAIFLHVAAPDGRLTEGCVALEMNDLRTVLAMAGPDSRLHIVPGG